MIGARAVEAGLADRVGSLEQLIQELSTSAQSPPLEGFFVATPSPTPPPKQEKTPMDLETLTKEHPSLVSQIRQEGAKAERSRFEALSAMPEAARNARSSRQKSRFIPTSARWRPSICWPAPRQKKQ
jgi:hypothetical protein